MKVGYCVQHAPHLASYRFRVAIPAPLLGCEYEIGCTGNPTFFYKHFEGDLDLARSSGPFVYDIVNDHFAGKFRGHYVTMCNLATEVTCSSEAMAEIIARQTGRHAIVIDDPYETDESKPECSGLEVLWLGHQANIRSLLDVVDTIGDMRIVLTVCSNYQHPAILKWSPETERRSLQRASVVLVTGNHPTASANRIVKALRAGRFVVTPGGAPAWDELRDYIWIGDVAEGIQWAFDNREEACAKITAGQEYVRERNSPQTISTRWMALFGSISELGTSGKKAGSASTMPTATATS